MAKDKGDKPKKDKAPKGAEGADWGSDDDFAKPSEAPAAGDGWNLTEEAEDELLIFYPTKEDEVETKDYGSKPVVVADVVVINTKKPAKSERHENVFIFGGYLRGSLRSSIGKAKVLGRLVRGKTKERGNFPWLLEDPSESDIEAAKAYLASVDPFAGGK